jgi:hypothetical protein
MRIEVFGEGKNAHANVRGAPNSHGDDGNRPHLEPKLRTPVWQKRKLVRPLFFSEIEQTLGYLLSDCGVLT